MNRPNMGETTSMNSSVTGEDCCCLYSLGQGAVVCQYLSMGLKVDRWLNVQLTAGEGYDEES